MKQMKKTCRPVVLTVNGEAELVVPDAETYRHILDRLDRFDAVEAIRIGIAAAEEGRGSSRAAGVSGTSGETWHFRLTSQNSSKLRSGGFAAWCRRSIRYKSYRSVAR